MDVEEATEADPSRIGSVEQFARALSTVRERSGLSVREVHKRTGIVASTLGGYFSGRHRPPVDALEKILQACDVTDPDEVAAWVDALVRVRRRSRQRVPIGECPYRGLEPFGVEDSAWFFGRGALSEVLVRRVLECVELAVPLVVVGPSGAGKSSLLRAGVVPVLEHEHGMRPVVLVPGSDPIEELHRRLGDDDTDPATPILIVVDQFEEVFAPDVPPGTAMSFASALTAIAAGSGAAGPAAVLIALRADFYTNALRLPELTTALQAGQILVGPMTHDDLREAINAPAVRAGLEIEDGLADLLLEDLDIAGGDDDPIRSAGVLPLLSHALQSTWLRSNRRRLTIADYRATGGVRGAIARSAEEIVEALGADREATIRQLFLRLVHISPDVAGTRRRVDRGELATETLEVLDRFVQRRLVVVDSDAVQLAHEALLVAWPRLRTWIEADRAGVVAHRQITDAARQWRDDGDDPDALLRGARLASAIERFQQPGRRTVLNDLERRFLDASEDLENRRAAARQREVRRLRALLASVSALLLVAVGLGAYSLEQRSHIATQRDVAVSRQIAVRADALRGKDPALAAQLAVAAYRIAATPEALSSLLNSTAVPVPARLPGPAAVTQSVAVGGGLLVSSTGSSPTAQVWRLGGTARPDFIGDTPLATGPVQAVALSPDARILAAGSTDGGIALFDLTDLNQPPVPLRSDGGGVLALTFTPDGDTLFAGTADGLRGWRLAPDAPPAELALAGATGSVNALAVSPNGQLLAAGGADGLTSVWPLPDTSTPAQRLTGSGSKVLAVAFSPDGRTLATGGGDRTVRLWDVAGPSRPQPGPVLTGPTNWVNSIAFAPDGGTIAAGSSDGHAWMWDTNTGRVTAQLPHPAPVTATAFVDAETLVTGEADGTARLWPIRGPVLTGFNDAVFALDFDDTGDVLAIGPGRNDNTAQLWSTSDTDGPRPLGPAIPNPVGEPTVSGAAALAPDGRTLAVGRVDGSVRLWDVTDPQQPTIVGAPLVGSTKLIEQLTISPDGRQLAVSGDDNTVRLWDISNPASARPLATMSAATSYVLASAFSPDGRLLAAASADTKTYLWDLVRPTEPRLLATLAGPTSYAYSPAFSPDGTLLAVGSADKTVRLWDLRVPAHPAEVVAPLVGPGNYVYSVAFSPDGTRLAAASTDGTIWLWELAAPANPRALAILTGPTDAAFSVVWSPDGGQVVAGSADRTVRVWHADPVDAMAYLCARAGSPVTAEEWTRFVPDLPYGPPCR